MSNPADPFEFVKQLWGQMAVPGFGLTANAGGGTAPGMPTLDPKDLEKRLAELKQVKQWLDMNLNMMNLQINTLEMQLAALKGIQGASEKMFGDKPAEILGGSASPSGAAPGQMPPWMDPQAWMKFAQAQTEAAQQAAQDVLKSATPKKATAKRSRKRP